MAGGKSPRRKGFGYERELVKELAKVGLSSKRTYGSDGRSAGRSADTDIIIEDTWTFQAERTATIRAKYRPTEGTDGSIFREDHGESFALIRLSFLSELLLAKIDDQIKQNKEADNG